MHVVHLTLEQGATWNVSLTYTDALNVPIALTPFRAHMQVRRRFGSPVLLDLSTENGSITLLAGGVIKIRGKARAPARINTTMCVYDLHLIKLVDPDDVTRVFGGTVSVQRAVTVNPLTV